MKICVTQEHIDKGKQNDPYCCPVALAMNEQYSNECQIIKVVSGFMFAYKRLGQQKMIDRFRNGRRCLKMNAALIERVHYFDDECGMDPFEFEIEGDVCAADDKVFAQ